MPVFYPLSSALLQDNFLILQRLKLFFISTIHKLTEIKINNNNYLPYNDQSSVY